MRLIATNHITAAILAAALSLPVGAAWAQTTAAAPAAASTGSNREANVEQRIADMHVTLQITPTQEAEWNKFAQVMLDNAQSMDMLLSKDAAGREAQTADQVLKGYAAVSEQHAQNVQKLSTAFNTLYASLTPEQKQQADDMFRQRAERRDQKQGAQMQNEQKSGMPKQGG